MLRRRSTKSKLGLRHHHKSSSSSSSGIIHHRSKNNPIVILQHLDPAVASRDAHIAAWEAYTRAQSRAHSDLTGAFPMSSADHQNPLSRRQSVRFVGSCDSSSVLEDGRNGVSSGEHPGSPPDRARTTAPLPLSQTARGYIDALLAGDEYYTPIDDIASMPSSFRHQSRRGLRRSQSSVSDLRGRGGNFLASGSLKDRIDNGQVSGSLTSGALVRRRFKSDPAPVDAAKDKPSEAGMEVAIPGLRSPKSMSFLSFGRRHHRSFSKPNTVGLADLPENDDDDDDNPTQTRRATTVRDRHRKTPSSWFGSWSSHGQRHHTFSNRRSEASMSLRMSSSRDESIDDDMENHEASETTRLHKMHGDTTERPTLKLKARKASRVFRTKLRSLFGSSSSQSRDQHRSEDRDRAGHNGGKEAQLPPQHISSRRSPDIPAILYPSGSYDDGRGNVGGVDHHNHANENGQAPTTPSQKAALRSTPSRTITIVRSPTPTKMLPRSREVSVEGYDQHSNPSNDRKENPQPATGTTSMVNNQDKNNASDNVQSNRNPSSSTAESNDTVSSSSLTSWFHSGPSTLTSVEQRQWREWEAKQMALQQQLQERLGVVGESDQSPGAGRNGDTGPTIRRRTLGELTNDGADVHGEGETATAPRPMVSSDRIYSALVKRMRERDGRALPSAFANEHHEVQEKKYGLSADSSYHDSSKTPDTIRHVPVPSQSDDEQPWRCHSRTSSSSVRTTIVNTPTRSSKKPPVGSDPARRTNQTWERSASMSTDVLGQRRWREEAEERKGWVEDDEGTGRSSNSRAWRKLGHQRQESPSNFAVVGESGTASPASNHLFRTQSSYRRALKRSMMEEEQKVWARHSSGTDWNAREDEQEDKWDREKKRWLDPSAQNDDVEPAETSVRYSESVQSSDEEDEAGPLRSAIDNGLSSAAHSHHRDPSAASSTDWMLSLSAHVGKLEAQKAMASPSKKITGTNEWGDSASQGRQLRNTAGSHRHNYHSAGLGHIREAAQVEDGRLSDEDDDSNYGDDPNASPAKPADHDVFHPAAHRHNVLQQQQKHQIDYYYPTGPLKQVEPNLPPSTATQHYTPENEIIRSNAKLQSVWDTASYVPHTNENRNPSYQAHAQQHATPPPIPPKSKLRQQQESPQLRPEPLRIMRQRPRTGVHTPVGLGPGPGPGTGSGVASPAASVLSSPGLTEAFMKQFGGGGGGGGKGMASLSGMVKGTEGSSPAFI